MYHLPLLPGYGPNTNVRSSAPTATKTGKSRLAHLSEAEENGYQGTYFTTTKHSENELREGYVSSSSPVNTRNLRLAGPQSQSVILPRTETDTEAEHEHGLEHEREPSILVEPDTPMSEIIPDTSYPAFEVDQGAETDPGAYAQWKTPDDSLERPDREPSRPQPEDDVAEVVFFEYGVLVFFGLEEQQEKDILEDIENTGILKRKIEEDDWEIEECHFMVRLAHSPDSFSTHQTARPVYRVSPDLQRFLQCATCFFSFGYSLIVLVQPLNHVHIS